MMQQSEEIQPVAVMTRQHERAKDGVMTSMRPGYALCRTIAQLLFIALFRGRAFNVQHVPRTGGVLLASNHQSFFDPVLATLAVPRECNYFARDTLFANPTLARVISYFNTIPVKRDSADTRALKELMRRLKDGRVVLAFPEGTRTHDGRIGTMRAGMVLVARRVRVPLVPTLIQGAFEAWPRFRKRPGVAPVLVAYGEPIYPHEHPEWDDDMCVNVVRESIVELQRQFADHPQLIHTRRRHVPSA